MNFQHMTSDQNYSHEKNCLEEVELGCYWTGLYYVIIEIRTKYLFKEF